MTPTPCPTCKGLCCGSLYHDEWGSPPLRFRHVQPALHTCPDCDDGTYEVCGDPEPFIRERSFKDEREAVLAFLRHALTYPNLTLLSSEEVIGVLHDAIAAGAHVEDTDFNLSRPHKHRIRQDNPPG